MATVPVTFTGLMTIADGAVTPTPPIYYPPGIWPGPGRPDQGLPGQPPGIWPGQGTPTHPIAGPPPGIWPGPGRPDQGLPGQPPGIWPGQGTPTHPIAGVPGHPSHPIYLPPGVWPGPAPSHPIVLPPAPSPGDPTHPIAGGVVVVWVPGVGWGVLPACLPPAAVGTQTSPRRATAA